MHFVHTCNVFNFYIIIQLYITIAVNSVYINTMAVLTKKSGVIYLIKLTLGSKKLKKISMQVK